MKKTALLTIILTGLVSTLSHAACTLTNLPENAQNDQTLIRTSNSDDMTIYRITSTNWKNSNIDSQFTLGSNSAMVISSPRSKKRNSVNMLCATQLDSQNNQVVNLGCCIDNQNNFGKKIATFSSDGFIQYPETSTHENKSTKKSSGQTVRKNSTKKALKTKGPKK